MLACLAASWPSLRACQHRTSCSGKATQGCITMPSTMPTSAPLAWPRLWWCQGPIRRTQVGRNQEACVHRKYGTLWRPRFVWSEHAAFPSPRLRAVLLLYLCTVRTVRCTLCSFVMIAAHACRRVSRSVLVTPAYEQAARVGADTRREPACMRCFGGTYGACWHGGGTCSDSCQGMMYC
jgi:hypothetical protein